ncbi:MAG TPA: iron-sulfur cluster loop [Bacteroidia bacterium]|nr:iron-sulfur cluster loop [Bacteroidia bacterium]HRS58540.1 iron-sulfur cluster loop [Bacteroidia bacterium]
MKNHRKFLLVEIGKRRFDEMDSQTVHFTNVIEIDNFLNDLNKYPHAFVLACLMDRQIKAERAWKIPYLVCKNFNSYTISELSKIGKNKFIELFEKEKLHRFNITMAEIFYKAILKIRDEYNEDASNIWNNNPSSASVVYKFLEFEGSGIKISTMAANILARKFKIPFSDYYSIDISPDVHVKRVMKRLGLVPENAENDMIIYKARELNPEFPGIIDFSCWEIGRNWCKPNNPDCKNCIMKTECWEYNNNA